MSVIDQAIAKIKTVDKDTKATHFMVPLKLLRELITLAKLGEKVRWIPVKERLPDDLGSLVLVAYRHGSDGSAGRYIVTVARYTAHWGFEYAGCYYKPDFWMLLPEPPKGLAMKEHEHMAMQRYDDDPTFHAIVSMLRKWMIDFKLSPSELYDAVNLADDLISRECQYKYVPPKTS